MNNITDNAFVPSTEEQVTDHFESTDTLADADGVDARNGVGSHAVSKETTPPYVLAEFEWGSYTDKVTGETKWSMRPIKSAVDSLILDAPSMVSIGIDEMTDEDHALARQLASDINNLAQTLIAVDTFQETALKRHFNNQLARKAIYAVRTARAADEWASRVKAQGQEQPDKLVEMLERMFQGPREVATFRSALLELDPTMEINFKAAAWDVMKYIAYTNQKKYLNPDELSNRQANEHGANQTLLDRMKKHRAA